jgi:heme A synthase
VLLGLHVLVAISLVAIAARVIRAARASGEGARRLAHWGAVMIGLTFVTGVITMITKNDWWSYAMALGFIALLLYGSLLVQAQRLAQQPD